jgi:hypothetical protein
MSPSLVLNLTCISFLCYCESSMFSLCLAHHLVGVAFNTISNASSLCCSSTCSSNFCKNVVMSINTSYLGGFHSSITIQCIDLVMPTHRHVETSCILYGQFSKPASESYVHKLMCLQLNTSSAMGLT